MSRPAFPFSRPDPEADDTALLSAILRCARRDLPSLRRLYDLSAPRLQADLLQLLGDPEEAAAALQECYVHIWHAASGYLPKCCPPRDWLRGVARQIAIDRLRELAPHDRAADAPALTLWTEDAEASGDDAAWRCLRLAYISGMTLPQLAGTQDVPAATVRSWLYQGLSSVAGGEALSPDELLAARHVLGVQQARVRRRYAARLLHDPQARRMRLSWESRLALLAVDPPPVRVQSNLWAHIARQLEAPDAPVRGAQARRWLWISTAMVMIALVWLWMRRPV